MITARKHSIAVLALLCAFIPALGWRFVSMADSRGTSSGNPDPPAAFDYICGYVAALNPKPEFVLFGGDPFWGMTDNTNTMRQEWTRWKQRIAAITNAGIPLYPYIGNHEANCGGQLDGGVIFAGQWPNLPQNGPSGLVGQVYTFRCENAQFFLMNTDIYNDESRVGANQRSWMKSVLDTCSAALRFACGHEPGYPPTPGENSCLQTYPADRDSFWKILTWYRFTAYICGHLHEYNRDFFRGANRPIDTTVHQVVNGTCGAPIYHGQGGEFHHYTVWDVNGNRITGHVYDNYNVLRDSFLYVAQGGIESRPANAAPSTGPYAEPNPFTRSVRIVWTAATATSVVIVDPAGRAVTTLESRASSDGLHTAVWDGTNLQGEPVEPGVYFCVVESSGRLSGTRVVKLR